MQPSKVRLPCSPLQLPHCLIWHMHNLSQIDNKSNIPKNAALNAQQKARPSLRTRFEWTQVAQHIGNARFDCRKPSGDNKCSPGLTIHLEMLL